MTPTQARAFLAVATEGSLSARLNVSQPTVSSQVGAVERQYKVELFHRLGRGVRAYRGGLSLPIVHRMFATFDEASAYLEDLRALRRWSRNHGLSAFSPRALSVLSLVAIHDG
jgi:DNA-binding transcriptional LysR family regulator